MEKGEDGAGRAASREALARRRLLETERGGGGPVNLGDPVGQSRYDAARPTCESLAIRRKQLGTQASRWRA
jgi:hypothetical protein